jgi:hypothetical protein
MSEVSREEFEALKRKVDALAEVLKRVQEGARFELDQHEDLLKRIAGQLGIAEPSESN